MPRIAKELSALEVRRLTMPGYYSVGGVPGLLLQVTPSGSRSWLLRVTVAGKRREIGLGSYPAVPLALAREKAQALRDEIAAGTDPVTRRKASREALLEQHEVEKRLAWTFRRCAEKFIEVKKPGWRNEKHVQQWQNTLASYAYPLIGDMTVGGIRVEHVMQVVSPYWTQQLRASWRGSTSAAAQATTNGTKSWPPCGRGLVVATARLHGAESHHGGAPAPQAGADRAGGPRSQVRY